MKKIEIDIISLFAIFLILISLIIIVGYYYILQIDKCTQDPLEYYIQRIEETTNADGAVGIVSITKKGSIVNQIHFGKFDFNETSFTDKNIQIESPYRLPE